MMSSLFRVFGLVILLSIRGQSELTANTVYKLLSDRLDDKLFDMKLEMRSLANKIDNAEQSKISERTCNACEHKLAAIERRLSEMDSHVRSVAAAEVLRRTQILQRGLQQEKMTVQRNTRDFRSRFDTLEKKQEHLEVEIDENSDALDTFFNETRHQIERLQNVTGTVVGFSARLTNHYKYENSTVIKFNEVYYNEGNYYNHSTGLFTAPVSGVYIFMFNVQLASILNEVNRTAHVVLYVNGQFRSSAIARGWSYDITGGNAAVVDITAGDEVCVATAPLEREYYVSGFRTTFSGVLIHVKHP